MTKEQNDNKKKPTLFFFFLIIATIRLPQVLPLRVPTASPASPI